MKLTMNLIFSLSIILCSYSTFATPEGELVQKRIEQRLPHLSEVGVDANGDKCVVDVEFPKLHSSTKEVKSLVPDTFLLNIYNKDLEKTSFHGSHVTAGGRGGCIYMTEDNADIFNFYMNSTPAPPCFGKIGRLSYSGRIVVRKLPEYKLQFQILDIDDDAINAQCTILGHWHMLD